MESKKNYSSYYINRTVLGRGVWALLYLVVCKDLLLEVKSVVKSVGPQT